MDVYTFLIVSHIIGTVLGVGGATFAEINITTALKDGKVSGDESALLHATYTTIRLGFFILLLSGFGFLVYYRLNGLEALLYSATLWAKLTIVGFIGINAVLLQTRMIPLLWGSAISLVSWYAALILGTMHGISYSYFDILFGYTLAVVLTYFVLSRVHNKKTS
tara:strand:+ start:9230 stop:9721 length:492 start_codon:yes stop_codon:yes gene_type:complete